MPKVRLNPTLMEFRGALGNMLFRKQFGKIFASIKPDMSRIEPSQAQVVRRQRFREAVAYGKTAMSNEANHALYEQAAKERQKPTFSLMVADYLNAPSIKNVDLSAYGGQVNDVILINAADDFGVVKVYVSISDSQHTSPIESGDAVETTQGSGLWKYTITSAVPPETTVNIKVVATDRPGGTAVDTQTKNL